MLFFLSLSIEGALAGALYALIALAFVVVYKASRVINFALGEWQMPHSLVATGAVSGLRSRGRERDRLRRHVRAPSFNSLVLRYLVGSRRYHYPGHPWLARSFAGSRNYSPAASQGHFCSDPCRAVAVVLPASPESWWLRYCGTMIAIVVWSPPTKPNRGVLRAS
jgi:hypothetical protein